MPVVLVEQKGDAFIYKLRTGKKDMRKNVYMRCVPTNCPILRKAKVVIDDGVSVLD